MKSMLLLGTALIGLVSIQSAWATCPSGQRCESHPAAGHRHSVRHTWHASDRRHDDDDDDDNGPNNSATTASTPPMQQAPPQPQQCVAYFQDGNDQYVGYGSTGGDAQMKANDACDIGHANDPGDGCVPVRLNNGYFASCN